MSASSRPDSEANASNTGAGPEPAGEPSAEAEPKKKRYYSPREVMKEKGCIGCGGMVLALVLAAVALAAALALL